jgi:ATP-dependent Clp protease adapter protein ClpS
MRHTIFLFVACLSTTLAFTTTLPPTFAHRPTPTTTLFASDSDKEGGAAIAKPKVGVETKQTTRQRQKSAQKQKAKSSEPVSRRDEDFQDAPMFKVMLIGDESYDQAHVVERLCEIMDDMDENQAAIVYRQAQQGGKAMCGKYPLEHAEMYKEQLVRSDPLIYSDVEDENK